MKSDDCVNFGKHKKAKSSNVPISEVMHKTIKQTKTRYCEKCSALKLRINESSEELACEVCEPEKLKPVKLPRRYLVILEYSEPCRKKPKYEPLSVGFRVIWLWFSFSFIRRLKLQDFLFGLPSKRDIERELRK